MTDPAPPAPPPARRWRSLEVLPGLVALATVWQEAWQREFPAFTKLCLQPATWLATSIPCPRFCGCLHSIILRHDRTGAIGICRCNPPSCLDIPLTIPEITPLQVNTPKLGRALAAAFALTPRTDPFPLPHTAQFGTWPAESTPAILTLQTDRFTFRRVVAELASQLRQPFALFAPTSSHLDAHSKALLQNHGAAFFPIDRTLTLTDGGTLSPIRPPAETFAHFLPKSPPPTPAHHSPPKPRYAIRKDCGVWRIIFDGQEAYIKHERGMFYVAYLLTHPDESFHALDLMAKIPEIYRQQLGLPQITDPATGKTVTLESHARLQERSLALDDREAMRRLYRKQKELEAILDDDSESEPVKPEALRELEAISQSQHQPTHRTKDAAHRAVDSVRKALVRLHRQLSTPLDQNARPHPVLSQFGSHLKAHLLNASANSSCSAQTRPGARVPGSFIYEPPPNLSWQF